MTRCNCCGRETCPTLAIPDPQQCPHTVKHWACNYACYTCLTAFEDARWPANADCEAYVRQRRQAFASETIEPTEVAP